MKIALHMHEVERQLYCPAKLKLKSLHSALNSMGDTLSCSHRQKHMVT